MINLQIIDELANKLSEVLPNIDSRLKQDLEKNFVEILQATFKKMDLVNSEELNVQKLVLENLEKKLEILEQRVKDLEEKKPKD